MPDVFSQKTPADALILTKLFLIKLRIIGFVFFWISETALCPKFMSVLSIIRGVYCIWTSLIWVKRIAWVSPIAILSFQAICLTSCFWIFNEQVYKECLPWANRIYPDSGFARKRYPVLNLCSCLGCWIWNLLATSQKLSFEVFAKLGDQLSRTK